MVDCPYCLIIDYYKFKKCYRPSIEAITHNILNNPAVDKLGNQNQESTVLWYKCFKFSWSLKCFEFIYFNISGHLVKALVLNVVCISVGCVLAMSYIKAILFVAANMFLIALKSISIYFNMHT